MTACFALVLTEKNPTIAPLFILHIHKRKNSGANDETGQELFAASARLPHCTNALLYILYLFAHLLNQHFKLDSYFGHFLVGRFRAQGIGFTVQFLH